jgi:hypothetical protein
MPSRNSRAALPISRRADIAEIGFMTGRHRTLSIEDTTMTNIWPICDGSGRYLVEADPDEEDGHVLYIFDPLDYFRELTTWPLRQRPRSKRPQCQGLDLGHGCPW